MFLNFTFKDIKNNWAQQRVHRMPQGWSIRKLSCFKLPLSGGYGNRPEPTGHATYPQPLAPILIENLGNDSLAAVCQVI